MSQPYNPVVVELEASKRAYDKGGPDYKFRALLYNVVDDPAQRVPPQHVQHIRFQQALREVGGADNPDRCEACLGLGLCSGLLWGASRSCAARIAGACADHCALLQCRACCPGATLAKPAQLLCTAVCCQLQL
jgi:hypothetical protein